MCSSFVCDLRLTVKYLYELRDCLAGVEIHGGILAKAQLSHSTFTPTPHSAEFIHSNGEIRPARDLDTPGCVGREIDRCEGGEGGDTCAQPTTLTLACCPQDSVSPEGHRVGTSAANGMHFTSLGIQAFHEGWSRLVRRVTVTECPLMQQIAAISPCEEFTFF